MTAQKISINLWFDSQAEEAARFYVSVFKNSYISGVTYYGKEGYEIHGRKEGTVMTVKFNLDGQELVALNGGPIFKFNEAVSLVVSCASQEEIDYYWNKLSEGGDPKARQCGWLKDKFGLSWQIVPSILDTVLSGDDKEAAGRVMNAMLKMKKIDIDELERAFRNN